MGVTCFMERSQHQNYRNIENTITVSIELSVIIIVSPTLLKLHKIDKTLGFSHDEHCKCYTTSFVQ